MSAFRTKADFGLLSTDAPPFGLKRTSTVLATSIYDGAAWGRGNAASYHTIGCRDCGRSADLG
jgi:hypothetical protein